MVKRNYCTIFDKNYLPRFRAMHSSMEQFCGNYHIYTFCMDAESTQEMEKYKLNNVTVITCEELELFDKELFSIKSTRSLIEYYFTCTPSLPYYIFNNINEVDMITYLDADLCFYSSPDSIFDELGSKSIAIVEHRFSKHRLDLVKNGIFNVAWITYRKDQQGLSCLNKYRQQCLDWCYDYLDGDKYGDQKYLDYWPSEYSNLVVIKNKGVNLAPWNVGNYNITQSNGVLKVDDNLLVFYHFAGLKQISARKYTSSISLYFEPLNSIVKNEIYLKYLNTLIQFSPIEDLTVKTKNEKYNNFSIKRMFINLTKNLRIYFFNDIIKL